jgi:N-carbamoyl-L-amino-acid hydrolase
MDRRAFTRLSAGGMAGLALGPATSGSRARAMPGQGVTSRAPLRQSLRVDGGRLNRRLDELARFGANAAGGIDRVAFSDADLAGRAWLAERMGEAGLEVRVDLAGNLLGRRPGREDLPPLWTGSHIDSVPGGGNYDGQVGSMAALEVALTLAEAGVTTRHPLDIVVFINEEGGKTGSRALIGAVEPMELDIVTASGYTIAEGIRRLGGDPGRLAEAELEPGTLAAFLELHVEQGAVLEADGVDIGVVEGIVGIKRWTVSVEGHTNHAGTTPMDRRRDALVAAARFVDAVYRTTLEMPGSQVATVGRIGAEPGAPNVIPGRATLSLEIRDLAMEKIDEIQDRLRSHAEEIGAGTGTTFAFEPFYESRAAPTHPAIRDLVEAEARELGLSTRRMPSGAGHDAQSVALLAPVGMIFVPSRDGISHAPAEYTSPDDATNGADVLLRTLLALDGAVPDG